MSPRPLGTLGPLGTSGPLRPPEPSGPLGLLVQLKQSGQL